MNSDYPPLPLPKPKVSNSRPQRPRLVVQTPMAIAVRVAKGQALRLQVAQINSHMRTLSPEQKRAIFLKLRHDRPIRISDLAGTGLKPMSLLTGTETLVIPKGDDLEKLDKRLKDIETNADPAAVPRGQGLGIALTSIEEGSPKDRLTSALAAHYDVLVTKDFLIYELEVTSFKSRSTSARKEVEQIVQDIRTTLGVSEGRVYEVDFAGCGALVLLSSTGEKFREFVEGGKWQRTITFFDERPRFQTFHEVLSDFNVGKITIVPPALDAETICIIDSGVAAGNPLLAPVIKRELCKSYVPGCDATVDEVDHGSGVASLAAYYDIDPSDGATLQAKAWIASARILAEDGFLDKLEQDENGQFRVRHARLLSSLLRSIVKDYVADGVRIFVLSFNIIGHYWSEANKGVIGRNAWVGRTIDEISREFDVVFVTITGNIDKFEVHELHGSAPYPKYFSMPLAKILDPGQAALAVTAGSISHSARVVADNAVAMTDEGKPSPFTRAGPGFGGAIKPDFVERGGNFAVHAQTRQVMMNPSTSILIASNRLTPALRTDAGTSYAAPRIAHHLAVIAHDFRRLGTTASCALLRAALASSAQCPSELHEWCINNLGDFDSALSLVGHGLPSGQRALECSKSRIALHFQGQIDVGKVAFFPIHVPKELADFGRGKKTIVVSVATVPKVQRWGLGDYLGVRTKFRLFRGDIKPADAEAYMALEEGDVNPRPDVSDHDSEVGLTARSVGTLQREEFPWKVHSSGYSDHPYTLAVALKGADWLPDGEQVQIGIVVRIEDETGACTTLYSSVKAAVELEVQAEALA